MSSSISFIKSIETTYKQESATGDYSCYHNLIFYLHATSDNGIYDDSDLVPTLFPGAGSERNMLHSNLRMHFHSEPYMISRRPYNWTDVSYSTYFNPDGSKI